MELRKKHGRVASSKGGGRENLSGGRDDDRTHPELARRHENRKSTIKSGRTIGETRERLETKNERAAARKKDKRQHFVRVVSVSLGFVILVIVLIVLAISFIRQESALDPVPAPEVITSAEPTIEIVDASASATGGKITSRMRGYIGLLESDLRSYGYRPTQAVIPVDSIREVDIRLDGFQGYIKTTIDRGAGVTAEDIDRMIRYLEGQGITNFEYIDVRLSGRAFWK